MPDRESPSNSDAVAVNVAEIALSSYNPTTLGHLRQPVPSDLPSHLDASVLTFQDAFEDLLAVSNGRPLPDINWRYQQSQLLRQMYPHGEPTWLWIRRLESQGLIRRPRKSLILSSAEPAWAEFQRDLEEGVEDFWRGIKDGVKDPKNKEAIDEVGKAFRELRDQFAGPADSTSPSKSQQMGQKKDQPDDFDELFSAIKSAYADGQGAWDAFKKTVNEDVPRHMEKFERRMEEKFKEYKLPLNGPDLKENEKEEKSEYVDIFGYKHTTVKRKTYDENGKEVGSSTIITIRRDEKDTPTSIENNDGRPNADDKPKKGWFW